jgi:aminoglycoside phosphotransferase (APT) family kinase protein
MFDYNNIFQKEGIIFEKLIRQSDRFSLVKGKKDGKNVVLKILINPARGYAKRALIREARTLKVLNNFPNVQAPKVLGFNFKAKYPYFFEEFIEGNVLEKKSGFFFKKLSKDATFQIAEILNNLIEIPLIKFKTIKNKTSFSSSYFKESFIFHQETINSNLASFQKNKLKKMIQIKPKKNFPVHGEVYPNNFIEDKKREIHLLDWENFGFGSLARDSASVYLRLKDKNSKQIFLNRINFKNQVDFEQLFSLEVILQSIGSLQYLKNERVYFLNQIKNFL